MLQLCCKLERTNHQTDWNTLCFWLSLHNCTFCLLHNLTETKTMPAIKIHWFNFNETFSELMSGDTESYTQTQENSAETIALKFRQHPEMDTPVTETSADELTVRSVDERIKQATDLIPRRVEEFCALLVGCTELESAANRGASSSRLNHQSFSPSGDWSNKCFRSSFIQVQTQWSKTEKNQWWNLFLLIPTSQRTYSFCLNI